LTTALAQLTFWILVSHVTFNLVASSYFIASSPFNEDTPPAPNAPPLQHQTHLFPAISHPSGTLSLAITYLSSPNFQLDELESILSSHFFSLDEGPEFTPTIVKNQQHDSLTGLPGGLPLSGSFPESSPPSSIADRFVLPAPNSHTHINSMTANLSLHLGTFPMGHTSTGAGINAGSISTLSIASPHQDLSTASSEEDVRPFSGDSTAAHIRLESMVGRSSSPVRIIIRFIHWRLMSLQVLYSSTTAPLPVRRQGANPVHPFWTSTLSTGSPSLHSPSLSLRQSSPLAAGNLSLPSPTSQNSSRAHIPEDPNKEVKKPVGHKGEESDKDIDSVDVSLV